MTASGHRARADLFAALAALAGAAVCVWAWAHHRLLLYGDATAHLAIARRMVDSATPGPSQWGTVWLPLPHLLMTPLVWIMPLWRTGIAGSIPSLFALALGTWFLYRLVFRHWGAGAAAWAAALYCLNPSLLYLAAVPMTESIYLAAFLGLVDAVDRQAVWQAGLWGLAGSMCRYDGWFVLPFALLALIGGSAGLRQAWSRAWRFCLAAGAGPIFWFGYNLYYLKDPLAFARGPYSARQIYLRALAAGGQRYPGDHAFWTAALYYTKTVVLTCGVPVLVLALAGIWLALRHRRAETAWAAGLLLLPLPWYLWAMWSGNVPIFVPQYWPHGYYNLRYGVQLLPAAAWLSGMAVAGLWSLARRIDMRHFALGVSLGLALIAAHSYLEMLHAPGPIAYAEAVHNAPDRIGMEHAMARALEPWRPGQRVLMYFGSYPGALADDSIPVHDVIQESNYKLWQAALAQPAKYVDWVVEEAGSPTATAINQTEVDRQFRLTATLDGPNQPQIKVYEIR